MWHDHTLSQRNKATKRLQRTGQNLKRQWVSNIEGGLLKIEWLDPLCQL